MTYEIKYEPITIDGAEVPKYNIYYTGGRYDGLKEFHSVDGINGEVREGYVNVNAPNWEKLEQDLRYFNNGALFGKALQTALPNPFSIFLKTLANGDKGVASQNALSFAFSILGVEWTEQEVSDINSLLEQNNFTVRL